MSRMIGTTVRGVRAPIIRPGDDLAQIVTDSVLEAAASEGFSFHDRDVVGVTEAVVAKAQGNYASTDDIAEDVRSKFGDHPIGVIFPILSRNRFAICLRGIARGAKKIVLMFSYPSDEVGNTLVSEEKLEAAGVNPWADVLDEKRYRALFGENKHLFTGVDYVEYYENIIREEGAESEIVFANRPETAATLADNILCCDIHSRFRTQRRILAAGAKNVLTLSDILNAPVNGSGYCPQYGLLGSNKATEDKVKLFPKNAQAVAEGIQAELLARTGVKVEAMVYGDGAFKDPAGKIWELADPVVSPGFTDGLRGLPNELKLKYLADNDFAGLSGEELKAAIQASIRQKDSDLKGQMASEGTTPRRLTDLIGSLCDLTSGSGDKGTPIIVVQNYFKNYAE